MTFISEDIFFTAMVTGIVNKSFCCIESFNDAVHRKYETEFSQKYKGHSEFLYIVATKTSDDANYSLC